MQPPARSTLDRIAVLLATGLGVGSTAAFAPGTLGALWGVPLAVFLYQLPAAGVIPAAVFHLAALLVLFLIGIPICSSGQRYFEKKDPGEVVWDEIATVPIVFFLVPPAMLWNPLVLVGGFLLHRLFDITKPPPCRQLEKLPGGLGIMADDVAAAAYGCGVLHLVLWLVG